MAASPDHAIIIRNYASLSDAELMNLATQNGEFLTQEALQLLSDEFTKRGLSKDVFFTIMKKRIKNYTDTLNLMQEQWYKKAQKATWEAAIRMKSTGKSDLEIWQVLTEEDEVEHEQATLVIWCLEQKISDLKKSATTEIGITGTISLFLICLLFGGMQTSSFIALIVLLLIRVATIFFKATARHSEYSLALKYIVVERHHDDL